MKQTDLSQQGPKGDSRGMWNSHRDTQHPVGKIMGTGYGSMRLMEGKYWDWGPAGHETHQRHSHTMEIGSHGMGYGCRE